MQSQYNKFLEYVNDTERFAAVSSGWQQVVLEALLTAAVNEFPKLGRREQWVAAGKLHEVLCGLSDFLWVCGHTEAARNTQIAADYWHKVVICQK